MIDVFMIWSDLSFNELDCCNLDKTMPVRLSDGSSVKWFVTETCKSDPPKFLLIDGVLCEYLAPKIIEAKTGITWE